MDGLKHLRIIILSEIQRDQSSGKKKKKNKNKDMIND